MSSAEIESKCAVCNKVPGDNWLACEICDKWFHAKCVNIKDDAYKVMQELVTCHWFCESCNIKVGKILPNLVNLHDKICENEKVISKVETEVEKINGQVLKVKSDVSKVSNEINNVKMEMDKHLTTFKKELEEVKTTLEQQNNQENRDAKWNEVVKKHVHESLEKVADDIQEVRTSVQETSIQAAEQRDKEGRRNNLIIYKIPESDEPRAEDRNIADVNYCLQLFNNCLHVGITEEDLVHVFRLGRRDVSTNPRPLMIQLARYTSKNLIMESLYKLKNAEQKFKAVVVSHDMTLKERNECKELVAEAKRLSSDDTSGEYSYRVRGLPGEMKIIKIRVRH